MFTTDFAHMNYIKSNRAEIVRYLKSMIEATRWLYDPKNKEEALAIHMKVLKSTAKPAEEDYKYLVQDFQPFPKDGDGEQSRPLKKPWSCELRMDCIRARRFLP